MLEEVASRKLSFGFSPNCSGTFSLENFDVGYEVYLQHLCEEALVSEVWPSDVSSSSLVAEFPALFSSTLGTANCAPHEIELSDPTPVR